MRRVLKFTIALCALSLPATRAGADPWPLGTFTPSAAVPDSCPSGYTCSGFTITAARVTEPTRGFLAMAPATKPPRGMVMFFTGGQGTDWWSLKHAALPGFAEELRGLGFAIVQVRWQDSWLLSSPGNGAGTAHLGALPATVIRYVYDNLYISLGIAARPLGEAGFCITGNSGGASQVGFALSHYGLEGILDVVIPTGGPPHSVLDKSCLARPGEETYQYPLGTRQFIDQGFGEFSGNGPAARQDTTFVPRWLEESHATGGNDYFHPETRIHFIFGAQDLAMQVVAGDYIARLASEGTPLLTSVIAPNTPHAVHGTVEGRSAIRSAILGGVVPVQENGRRVGLVLEQNVPNPFRAWTRMSFQLSTGRRVRLAIHDVAGRQTAMLVDGTLPAGRHDVQWDGTRHPAGIYFAVLSDGESRLVGKLLLLK